MFFSTLLEKGFAFPSESAPLNKTDITLLEAMISSTLPLEYQDYLLHANGGEVVVPDVPEALSGYGVLIKWPAGNGHLPDEMYSIVQYFFDLEDLCTYYDNWKVSIPENTIVIGRDPGTTFYLLGFGKHNYGKITAWRVVASHQLEANGETSSIAFEGAIADNFVEFLLSLKDLDIIQNDSQSNRMKQLMDPNLDQLNLLEPETFLRNLEEEILSNHPWVSRALPARECTKTIQYAIDRAKIGNGFIFDLDIRIFVDLMFKFSPDFDQNAAFRELLDNKEITPSKRWIELTENVKFNRAWEKVAKNASKAKWQPESHGKISKAYPLTYKMPGFQALYNKVRADQWPYLEPGASLSDF